MTSAASLTKLEVENGRLCSAGLDLAIFLISRRSGNEKVLVRPPLYFGYSEAKPSALKLWITSRTRSALVNATAAILSTGILCAESSTARARRQGHHGPGAPAIGLQQPLPLVVIDLPHAHTFSHVIILDA